MQMCITHTIAVYHNSQVPKRSSLKSQNYITRFPRSDSTTECIVNECCCCGVQRSTCDLNGIAMHVCKRTTFTYTHARSLGSRSIVSCASAHAGSWSEPRSPYSRTQRRHHSYVHTYAQQTSSHVSATSTPTIHTQPHHSTGDGATAVDAGLVMMIARARAPVVV